ncbi:MAG: glutamate-cysteine ligase family protein [Candidatus Nanopelagicales bacterium]
MGERVEARSFTGEDRMRYRQKVHRCLDVVARMFATARFDFEIPMTGTEIELSLVDPEFLPAMRNDAVLQRVANPSFTEELGRFNLEINVRPQTLEGTAVDGLEADIRRELNDADGRARDEHAGLVMIGILPTLRAEQLTKEAISDNPRYALLDEQMLAMRGEDLHLDIDGVEHLEAWADTIAPEAGCTSVQFHLQVDPDLFPAYWNAAQVLAGVQVAVGANSPYFGGHELWRETRIALFTQAADTRSVELKAQGVRPRVWFGERYVTNVFDLFEENIRYFPALLPIVSDENPEEVLASGGTPLLPELRLLNGTVWRWNRPVYDVVGTLPHIRLENRVLPSGPSVVDVLANGALYYGALRALVDMDRPIWSQLSFDAAEDNFLQAARYGLEAEQYWPGMGEVPAPELVLRRILPLAQEGLQTWGVDSSVIDRLLGIVEQRCITGRNGAVWQVEQVHAYEDAGLDRWEALRRMTGVYIEHMHRNDPVHTWPVD